MELAPLMAKLANRNSSSMDIKQFFGTFIGENY